MKHEDFDKLLAEVKRLDDQPAAYLAMDISRLRAGHCADKVLRFNKPKQKHIVDVVPLYKKREWVRLTDEEINSWDLPVLPTLAQFARFIEAKLKEKNNAT
jgi:hypothetical protein